MSERDIDAEDVRREHMSNVNVRVHTLYLLGVIVGGTVLMLALLVVLEAIS
jgi:hypothetical protein